MEFKVLTARFTSRKFLLALLGVILGIIAIIKGETVAGCSLIGSTILAYLAAEGYIDAQSAKAVTTSSAELAEIISKVTENTIDDKVAKILIQMANNMPKDALKEVLKEVSPSDG